MALEDQTCEIVPGPSNSDQPTKKFKNLIKSECSIKDGNNFGGFEGAGQYTPIRYLDCYIKDWKIKVRLLRKCEVRKFTSRKTEKEG